MKKLKEIISNIKQGLKKDAETNLTVAAIKARWDAMCQFVDNAAEYGIDDDSIECGLMVINRIRKQHLCALPTEYFINKRMQDNDERVKLTFNNECTLFELDTQTDFITYKSHKNLQTKFLFDDADKLTKVFYREKHERDRGNVIDKYDSEKVIDLRQKQINQEDATEMTK